MSIFEALSTVMAGTLCFTYKEFDSNKRTAVVHQGLVVFANIDLQVIVFAPCDEALNHSCVFLSESKNVRTSILSKSTLSIFY